MSCAGGAVTVSSSTADSTLSGLMLPSENLSSATAVVSCVAVADVQTVSAAVDPPLWLVFCPAPAKRVASAEAARSVSVWEPTGAMMVEVLGGGRAQRAERGGG